MKKLLLLLFISSTIYSTLFAQNIDKMSNPKIWVRVNHPPSLGLKIDKVIFNSASGKCADEVVGALISKFVTNGVEVIDRDNLDMILAEHDFNNSGYVDQSTAASIGKIIGPSAMITTKIIRCHSETKPITDTERKYNASTESYYYIKAYYSKTTVNLKVSIQTTDLATGKIFASKIFDYSKFIQDKSYNGFPESPSEFEVLDLALSHLTNDVHKLFFSWSEKVNLYFMNDKKGNLKAAFQSLKVGDIPTAFDLSESNLENCKNDPEIKEKILAHAYYNLGMMYFIYSKYDKAIANFNDAQKLRPGNITTYAISECNKAKALAEEMQRVDDKAQASLDKSNMETQQAQQAQVSNTLTNQDIIDLVNKKLPEGLIIQKIKTSPNKFDTSTEGLIKLTESGVSEDIIIIMMEKK